MSIHETFYIMLAAFSLSVCIPLALWRRAMWIDDYYLDHGCDPTVWWAWPDNKGWSAND